MKGPCHSNSIPLSADLLVCLLGYTLAVSYNTSDFANTGEAPALCFWLAIINCVTGLVSIASLTTMAVLSYLGIARNEFSQQSRMSRKFEVLLISGGIRGVVIGNLVKCNHHARYLNVQAAKPRTASYMGELY